MNDLMVDIETLGTGTRGLITQIGACYFNRNTGEIGDTFCENIRIQDSLDNGFEVDGGAIKFWFQQDPEIRAKMVSDAQDVGKVLGHFKDFCKKGVIAWAHATFDFPILMHAYRRMKQGAPISYRCMRDIRTLVDLGNIPYEKPTAEQKTHNALDDCLYQVSYCVKCFAAIKKRQNCPHHK